MLSYDVSIIRIKGEEFSESLANDCLRTCKQYGYNAKLFDAYYGKVADIQYTQLKLKPFKGLKEGKQTQGAKGCLLSHLHLWNRCLQKNKPIVVLEHDALFIRHIPVEALKPKKYDLVNFDIHSRTKDDYTEFCEYFDDTTIYRLPGGGNKKRYDHHNVNHIKGSHGYVIHPEGANKLVRFIEEFGWLPVDLLINPMLLNAYATKAVITRINPKAWNEQKRKPIQSYTR